MRVRLFAAVAVAACVLYFFGLARMGLVGPDEPRYASIGREMARSGDWVTPRLWGAPWFEKPALLYWMTAAGFRLGLDEDLAPRLPVALAGLGFLAFYWRTLRRHFGPRAGWYAAAILGTSGTWVAYSSVGVTDLPMTAAFAAAMLVALDWVETGERRRLPLAAALLGAAVLAKGLVPVVLAAPLLLVRPRRALDWFRPFPVAAFLAVAAPWYLLCWLRNGAPFIRTFFWQHQLGRFASDALKHEQPFWFYVPVLLAVLLPWTPLLAPALRRSLYKDRRCLLLLAWAMFGFLFFSASTNKLPGYLLPLLPAVAALMGIALEASGRPAAALASCAVMLLAIPVAVQVLPQALAGGLSRVDAPQPAWWWLAPLALSAVVWRMRTAERAMALVVVAAAAGLLYLKVAALPAIDKAVSARSLWRQVAGRRDQVCMGEIHRAWAYGLNYYSVTPLPPCAEQPKPLRITQERTGRGRPAPPALTVSPSSR